MKRFRGELWLVIALLLGCSNSHGQFRSYSLPCLAPILQNIDATAPKTLQEAYLSGPKYFAGEIDGIGTAGINFPISTESAEAQKMFTQGVTLLHLLSFREAAQAFRTVVHLDPACPMGYWGLAQASELNPGRARIFAKTAAEKCDRNRPELEQRWTQLLAKYYADDKETDLAQRTQNRIRDLESLVMDFPENVEAKAFLIRRLVVNQYRVGSPVTSQLGVDALIEQFTDSNRKHPSRHYRAFLWLQQRPQRILSDTLMASALSPESSEAWRYAGEAHSAAGLSREAIILNEMAIRTSHRKLIQTEQMPSAIENLQPNYVVHIETLTEAGRINEAITWAKRLISLPGETKGEQLYVYAMMKSAQWQKLLDALETDPYLNTSVDFSQQAQRLNWKGLCYLALGQQDQADNITKQLKALQSQAVVAGSSNAEERSIASSIAQFHQTRKVVTNAGNFEKTDLPPLIQAAFYRLAGDTGKALQAVANPSGWLTTANFCHLAVTNGRLRDALFHFDRNFRSNAAQADPQLPILKQMPALAEKINLAADEWQLQPGPVSISPIPDLESAGPPSWQPAPAPDFSLTDRFSTRYNLEKFSGKPVILNFFLGAKCPFCLQQFEAFQPFLPAFEEAGITMAAISSDSVEMMQEVFGDGSEMEQILAKNFPFPVLADPKLEVFRKYRVFDDFENGPMHATILLDSKGRILWQNISHGTYKTPAKLLNEAKRLLTIHQSGI